MPVNNDFRKLKRYVYFYMCVVFFFTLYSYVIDLILIKLTPGSGTYIYSIYDYPLYFIILCFPVAVPLIVFYNWIVNNAFETLKHKNVIRLLFGLVTGFLVGLAVGRNGLSFYIGEYKWLKNLILYSLIGISVEVVRVIVVNKRYNTIKSIHT